MEKFFMRCNDGQGNVIMRETEGEFVFEIKGFRFFYHDGAVSDVLCGIRVVKSNWVPFPQAEESKIDLIDRARGIMERKFDDYLQAIKKRPKVTWRPNPNLRESW